MAIREYLDALEEAWALYDPDVYEERVETWWEQVVDAAADDSFLSVSPGSNDSGAHTDTDHGSDARAAPAVEAEEALRGSVARSR